MFNFFLCRKIALSAMLILVLFLTVNVHDSFGQNITPDIYSELQYRHIGPEGNRCTSIIGQPGNPYIIYVGAASGGIWKSVDNGLNWKPIFDKTDVSSIGALAIAPSDPNIVWAGTGEANIRSSISVGNGVYKSADGGKTWNHMGLEKTGRIGRVLIHPTNPDIVLVAALGHSYGPQEERGVFKTTDGGKTWNRVLFTDDNTGSSDIAMDPVNPRNIVAGMWPLDIKTWERRSGGPNGGVFISRDGGDTWIKQTNELPDSPTGNIAVGYAPNNPDRIYALIETDQYEFKGVLWRSDDGGESWNLISRDQQLHTRPHYYTELTVAPDNDNEVWFLASRMSRTFDGGKTSEIVRGPLGDNHNMWIDPLDPDRVLVANDGGVYISANRGQSWYHPDLPIAQMYHVSVDDQIPYYVYGNKQDGPTYRIPSNRISGGGGHSVGGGEAGFTFPDPFDNTIIWASNEQGVLTRYDLETGHTTNAQVWPETPVGRSPRDIKYRWVWSYPFILSQHTQNTIYAGSQYVHKTTDGGFSWNVISPDLTTDDPSMQVNSGGLTYDNVGVDYGTALYALAESPLNQNLLWAGSNDGLLHVTRDGGTTWENVTKNISDLPSLGTFTSIETSRFTEGKTYITVDFHQVNDRSPYIYKTENFGRSWEKITDGIPHSMLSYAQIIREDPVKEGLLFLGTENMVYVSFNDGNTWMPLRNNMPPAPVRWLAIQKHFSDLVIGTYGRGFWIMDDITPLRELSDTVLDADIYLFEPRDAYRFQETSLPGIGGGFSIDGAQGYYEDPPYGASINYYMKEIPDEEITINILDNNGTQISSLTGTRNPGLNRVHWDLYHESSPEVELRTPPLGHPGLAFGPDRIRYNEEGFRRLFVEGSGPNGPLAAPGTYTIVLTNGDTEITRTVEVLKDPNSKASSADIQEQVGLALNIKEKVTLLVEMGNTIERLRKQIDDLIDVIAFNNNDNSIIKKIDEFDNKLIDLEKNFYPLYITGASENLLRFPAQLYSHFKMLGYYVMTGDARPTQSKYEVFEELSQRLQTYQGRFNEIINEELPEFNETLKQHNINGIFVSNQ